MNLINIYRVVFLSFFISTFSTTSAQNDENLWKVLPIRSQEEFNSGAFGGEGEQHPHSIARCYQHPEYIYLSQDVGGSWRSTDNGETWHKNPDKGLFLQYGQSIEVDPVNPDILFLIVDDSYNYLAKNYQGVYRSEDSGKNWNMVLQADTKIVRIYRHNIAFDATERNEDIPAKTWYAALTGNGLYRSDDGGKTWGQSPVSSLKDFDIVYQVKTDPVEKGKVYVATNLGLFVSTDYGTDLTRIESLPENVSSVAVNPQHPDSMYATVVNNGLYISVDGGTTFKKLLTHDALRLHMNQGFPEEIYLVGKNRNSKVSHDGEATWKVLPEATTFPGLGRETGWRRWIDGNLSGIVPNPQDKNEAVFYSRSTLFKTTDGAKTIAESARGWTGNAWSWTDNSAAFDRFDPDKFAFFCNDIGTRITTNGGDWFHENTNSEAGKWYPDKIAWYGTYAGDFYPKPGSQTMVAAIGNYFKTQLMRTENLGKTWELVTEGSSNENMNLFVAFNPNEPDVVYAGNKYSTDGGKTFNFFPFPEKYSDPYVIGMCDAYPDVIYALDKNCTVILRSCDQGWHWEEYAKPGWKFNYFDNLPTFAADPVNPIKVYTLDRNHDLASFDGNKWTSFHVMNNITNIVSFNYIRNVAVDPNNPDIIYAGMFASGGPVVFRTLDGGKSWQDISSNLSRMPGTLKVNPHTGELFRGSLFGTWIYPAPYKEVPTPSIPEFKTGLNIIQDSIWLAVGETIIPETEQYSICKNNSSVHWASDNSKVATVNNDGKIIAISAGTSTIFTSTGGGNFADSCMVQVYETTGFNLFSQTTFSAYLNQYNQLMITFPDAVQLSCVSLYNLLGSKIFTKNFESTLFTKQRQIDTSMLTSGCYMLAVATRKGFSVRKVVKK